MNGDEFKTREWNTRITNPLTIIALFAGMSETCASATLPFLQGDIQKIYIWFLMTFPFGLVILFFLTLWLKHKILYAPSDYRDENNFFRDFCNPTLAEKFTKVAQEEGLAEKDQTDENIIESRGDLFSLIAKNPTGLYRLVEELAVSKLSNMYKYENLKREQMFRGNQGRYLFDAVAQKGGRFFFIEVKYVTTDEAFGNVLRTARNIFRAVKDYPIQPDQSVQVVIVIVYEERVTSQRLESALREMRTVFEEGKISLELQCYRFSDLKNEFPFDR